MALEKEGNRYGDVFSSWRRSMRRQCEDNSQLSGLPLFLPFSLPPSHCLSSLSHIFPSLPFPRFSDKGSSFQNVNQESKEREETEVAPHRGWRNVHNTARNQFYFHLFVYKQMFDSRTHCEQIHRSSPVLTQLWSHSLCFRQGGMLFLTEL